MHIIIHRVRPEKAQRAYEVQYQRLYNLFGDNVHSERPGVIVIKNDVRLEFRTGSGFSKLAGVRPDYYHSDSVGD